MTIHLEKEISVLKDRIILLGTIVEESVFDAVKSVNEKDIFLAKNVIDKDYLINQTEVEIEEECLKLLALHQPVAIDLRFIVAVLKINNDLERIGDLAENIASRTLMLSKLKNIKSSLDMTEMTKTAQAMLKLSLDALVSMDASIARDVLSLDIIVDENHRKNFEEAELMITKETTTVTEAILLLSVSKNIERIADHATNIAEDIIYMVEGDIIRHQVKNLEQV